MNYATVSTASIIDKIIEEVVSSNGMKSKVASSQIFKEHYSKKGHKRKRQIQEQEGTKKRLCSDSILFSVSHNSAKVNGHGEASDDKDICKPNLENDIDRTVESVINEEFDRQLRRSIPRPVYDESNDTDNSLMDKKKQKGHKNKVKKKEKHLKKTKGKLSRNHSKKADSCISTPKLSFDKCKSTEEENNTFNLSPISENNFKPPPSPILVLSNETEEILRNASISHSPIVKCERLDCNSDEKNGRHSSNESCTLTEDLGKGSDAVAESFQKRKTEKIQNVNLQPPIQCDSILSNGVVNIASDIQDRINKKLETPEKIGQSSEFKMKRRKKKSDPDTMKKTEEFNFIKTCALLENETNDQLETENDIRTHSEEFCNVNNKQDNLECGTTDKLIKDGVKTSNDWPKLDYMQPSPVEIESNLKISCLKTITEWDNDSPEESPNPFPAANQVNFDVKAEIESGPVVVLADVMPILNPIQKLQLCQSNHSQNDLQKPCGTLSSTDACRNQSVAEPLIDACRSIASLPEIHTISPVNVPDDDKKYELSKPVFQQKGNDREQSTQSVDTRQNVLRNGKEKPFKHIAIKQLFNYTEIVIVVESLKNQRKKQRALPKEYNYLNIQALKELLKAFLKCKNDESCKAVLLSSVGPIFCSGVCPLALLQYHTDDKAYDVLTPLKKLIKLLITFTKPLVAAVQGPAVDFGASLLLFCDSVFASDKANFHWSSAMQSLSPYGCMSALLPQITGKIQASALMLGGKTLTATEAQALGLVTEVFPHDILANSVIPRCLYLSTTLGNGIFSTKELLVNQKKKELLVANEVEMKLLMQCLKSESNRMIMENYIATKIFAM